MLDILLRSLSSPAVTSADAFPHCWLPMALAAIDSSRRLDLMSCAVLLRNDRRVAFNLPSHSSWRRVEAARIMVKSLRLSIAEPKTFSRNDPEDTKLGIFRGKYLTDSLSEFALALLSRKDLSSAWYGHKWELSAFASHRQDLHLHRVESTVVSHFFEGTTNATSQLLILPRTRASISAVASDASPGGSESCSEPKLSISLAVLRELSLWGWQGDAAGDGEAI